MLKLQNIVLTLREPITNEICDALVESNMAITVEYAEVIHGANKCQVIIHPWEPGEVSESDILDIANHFDAIFVGLNHSLI